MASYFDEHDCEPLRPGETPNHFLHLARLLVDCGLTDEFQSLFLSTKPPPPTSKAFMENIPEHVIPEGCPDENCPVCLKEFEEQEHVKLLPCKHHFHSSCIIPWLQKTSSCPVCRHELPTDDKDYEQYKVHKKREKEREEDLKTLHDSMFS